VSLDDLLKSIYYVFLHEKVYLSYSTPHGSSLQTFGSKWYWNHSKQIQNREPSNSRFTLFSLALKILAGLIQQFIVTNPKRI